MRVPARHPDIAAPLSDAVTRRLALRRLAGDALDELASMFADRDVWQFEYERGLTIAETRAFLDRQMQLWAECGFGGCAVRDRRDRRLLGVVGLGVPTVQHQCLPAVTVGWRFASTAWGHGYATEAATALLRQAFGAMRLNGVGCVTNAENDRSVAVARRLGMEIVGEVSGPRDDGVGTVVATILRVDRERWIEHDDRDATA
jgi:RimJ/RimL family protein N-acetyltransferase